MRTKLALLVILLASMNLYAKKKATPSERLICDPQAAIVVTALNPVEMKTSTSFVKAASGVSFVDGYLYVIQDSSRYLAKFAPALDKGIEFFPLAPKERIETLEDPTKPYEEFRKDRKADFEAMTTLADGRILIFGSGYDAKNIGTSKTHYRNIAVIFDTEKNSYEEVSLEAFYKHLLARKDFVGKEKKGVKPRLNIEGVTSFDGKIAFFHRANYNKNRHDAVILFETESWLKEIRKDKWELKEAGLMTFDFGTAHLHGEEFPITLNDAEFVDGHVLIPVASEADTIVDGKDVDGEVIWTGIAKVDLDQKTCVMYKLDDPKMPKIEGITADPREKGRFFVVHDVDSEVTPSLLSYVRLSK